jgi:hypothetical protein
LERPRGYARTFTSSFVSSRRLACVRTYETRSTLQSRPHARRRLVISPPLSHAQAGRSDDAIRQAGRQPDMAALPPPAVCRRRVVARLFVSLYLRAFMTGELSARGARTYYRTIKLPLANARDDGRGDVGLGWLVGCTPHMWRIPRPAFPA